VVFDAARTTGSAHTLSMSSSKLNSMSWTKMAFWLPRALDVAFDDALEELGLLPGIGLVGIERLADVLLLPARVVGIGAQKVHHLESMRSGLAIVRGIVTARDIPKGPQATAHRCAADCVPGGGRGVYGVASRDFVLCAQQGLGREQQRGG
jgi:hypothetical protein